MRGSDLCDGAVTVTTKTGKRETRGLSPPAAELALRAVQDTAADAMLVTGRSGRPLSTAAAREILLGLARTCGVPVRSVHQLRAERRVVAAAYRGSGSRAAARHLSRPDASMSSWSSGMGVLSTLQRRAGATQIGHRGVSPVKNVVLVGRGLVGPPRDRRSRRCPDATDRAKRQEGNRQRVRSPPSPASPRWFEPAKWPRSLRCGSASRRRRAGERRRRNHSFGAVMTCRTPSREETNPPRRYGTYTDRSTRSSTPPTRAPASAPQLRDTGRCPR